MRKYLGRDSNLGPPTEKNFGELLLGNSEDSNLWVMNWPQLHHRCLDLNPCQFDYFEVGSIIYLLVRWSLNLRLLPSDNASKAMQLCSPKRKSYLLLGLWNIFIEQFYKYKSYTLVLRTPNILMLMDNK